MPRQILKAQLAPRSLTILLSLIGTALVAYTTSTGPHSPEHYVWDWEVIPYLFLAFGLSIIFNITIILLHRFRSHAPHPGIEVAFDLFLTICLIVDGGISTVIAKDTLEWNASHWSNDEAYDAYREIHPNGTRYWEPARPYTPCSGFGSCAEEQAYTARTHHRAVVEFVAVGFAFAAGALHLGFFVWACVRTNKHNRGKRAKGREALVHATATSLVAGQGRYVVPVGEKGGMVTSQQAGNWQENQVMAPRWG